MFFFFHVTVLQDSAGSVTLAACFAVPNSAKGSRATCRASVRRTSLGAAISTQDVSACQPRRPCRRYWAIRRAHQRRGTSSPSCAACAAPRCRRRSTRRCSTARSTRPSATRSRRASASCGACGCTCAPTMMTSCVPAARCAGGGRLSARPRDVAPLHSGALQPSAQSRGGGAGAPRRPRSTRAHAHST